MCNIIVGDLHLDLILSLADSKSIIRSIEKDAEYVPYHKVIIGQHDPINS